MTWDPAGVDQWYGHASAELDCPNYLGITLTVGCQLTVYDTQRPTAGAIFVSATTGNVCKPGTFDFGPASGGHLFRASFIAQIGISPPNYWEIPTFFCADWATFAVTCSQQQVLEPGVNQSFHFL